MQKIKFDARSGPTAYNQDFYANPGRYSFVHNFKVHYKVSVLQALANKVDISISIATPQIPSTQDVMTEFNQRMQLGNVGRNMRGRFSAPSYHVTNIEYKESVAFFDPQSVPRSAPAPQAQPQVQYYNTGQPQIGASKFCTRCGTNLPADSHFCISCGAPIG